MQTIIMTFLVACSLLVGCSGCQLPILVQAQECPAPAPFPTCDLELVEMLSGELMEIWLCDGDIVVMRPALDHRAL